MVGVHYSGVYGVANSAVGVGTLRDLLEGKQLVSVTVAAETTERGRDEVPDKPFAIRYTHLGVRFSTSRRQPVMTA